MIIQKPPMGWNTWNTFGNKINEQLIMESADAMVDTGLLDAGYEYVVIDDMWSLKERDSEGRLVPDPEKFPHGMKYLADYIHSKGLKFGIYSCGGYLTCGGYPGSYGHEWTDARTFAEWGVDYLKYDFCYHPKSVAPDVVYKRMGLALAHCGRDILFSACSWGFDKTPMWIRETGAHCWRSTGDISDSWVSIKNIAMSQLNEQVYNAPGCFNDMDMLVVGMHGNGNVGLTGCTEEEYKLHFSFWSFLSSPLMIGCDIRNMTEETKCILLNKDIITINQDTAGRQAFVLNLRKQDITDKNPEAYGYILDRYTMARYLENGDIAIAMFNFLDVDTYSAPLTIQPDMLGLPEGFDRYEVQDLWTGEILKSYNGTISPNGPCKAHGCQMFRLRILP